jgi:hypothetical protein
MAHIFSHTYDSRSSIVYISTDAEMVESLWELDETVCQLKGLALEESTKRSHATHRSTYVEFCDKFGVPLTPITQSQAERLAVSSVKKYMNFIRIVRLEDNLPNLGMLQMYKVIVQMHYNILHCRVLESIALK